MARPCSVCTHSKRDEIDRLLTGGTPAAEVARRYGLVARSVRRHAASHLPAVLVKAEAAREVTQANGLLAQVEDLRQQAQSIKDQAVASGDLRTALQGIRELVRIVELLAKLRGELDERPVVNVLLSPQWVTIRAVLLDALTPYPDARTSVASALLEVEGNGRGG